MATAISKKKKGDAPADDRSPLSAAERGQLQKLEARMRINRKAAEQFHKDLTEVYSQRLYRQDHATFEAYLTERWGISRSQGYRLVDYSETVEQVTRAGLPAPTEWVARPMAGLPEETKLAVYAEAIEASGGAAPDLGAVKAAVERVAPKAKKAKKTEAEKLVEAGVVAPGAEIEVFHAEPGAEPAPPENVPDGDTRTDEQWLESLPARAGLGDACRGWFDAEALAFRAATPHRLEFRAAVKPLTNAAKKAAGGHIGPWTARYHRFMEINGPERWQACGDCGGTGRMELIGECPGCKGHGYKV